MTEAKMLERTKSDFSDLGNYLLKNGLLDDRKIWFAGFDNYRKANQNVIAGNLLYGNKRLVIVAIKDNEVYYLNNTRKGFKLTVIGTVDEKYKVSSLRNIIYPTIDITSYNGQFYSVKVTKHKESLKEFKQVLKQS